MSKLPQLAMIGTSLMVGLTMVMGINAINSAPSFMLNYYEYLAGREGAKPRSPVFWKQILNFYTVVTIVAQAVHEPTNLTSFMCRFSLLFRLEVSCALMIIELLVILLMPHTHVSEYSAIAALMIVAYLGGAARAYFENTGYAMFGPCPPVMLSGMLVGSALAGALLSVVQIVLLASMPSTYNAGLTQSLIYFCTAIGIICISGLLLTLLLFNPFARRYIAEFRSHRSPWANIYRHRKTVKTLSGKSSAQPGASKSYSEAAGGAVDAGAQRYLDNSSSSSDAEDERELHEAVLENGDHRCEDVLFDDREYANREEREAAAAKEARRAADGKLTCADLNEHRSLSVEKAAAHDEGEVDEGLTTAELLQEVKLWPVIKKIWPMMLTCFLTFGITYLIYPGIMLAVDSSNDWYTTLIMTVYNFADLFGRIASMWKRLWPPRNSILIVAISRIIFVLLIVLCALHKIPSKVPPYIFAALMGVSNGFIGTLSIVYSPETPSLTTDGERAMAGQVTGACLLIGCAVGSLVQLALVLPFN
ncbi:nucleobase transporter (NT4) [Leptomonas pyrrhocoris]|uniref:Nucleobase transporter (NT4) n=1 Tax=Leptomonas pyrrhocoris TaxID=157538 RepID=A0A0M9FVX1_LEPPY|nr:nucleobase transporter (NT4) [Leptomonas pyrrhocoris]XP_015655416.1 nucleobase transporter (NT4) [Leptomonas pyrrhocoris]KPA76976.1 nucleobase transporter (NT4) [Leptomonas pyrrhocoris]KPA76977.1 nucleobase transporter (NT4) [Leptomonas pyrrhocoris]|eukprot:XP_015655415.1 nucleobase transporter (NT4) [Leptomonas pyrrhocoris]